jgi:uncharacterized protein (TIGR02117 family)
MLCRVSAVQCRLVVYRTALALALGLLGAACAGTRVEPGAPSGAGPSAYVVNHGWHVGLVLRRQDLSATSLLARFAPGPFQYLEVGWGDGDYYPAARGTIALALRAAFRSRGSVLQVVGFNDPVTTMFPEAQVVQVELTPEGLAVLARYVDATYAVDPDGRPIVVAPAEYGVGVFYRARGQYELLDNSNTWAARGLRIAGCPIDIDTVLTAGAVLLQVARFGHVLRGGFFVQGSGHSAMRCPRPALIMKASP